MRDFFEALPGYLVLGFLVFVPIIFTVMNIISMFIKKRIMKSKWEISALVIGFLLLVVFMTGVANFYDYDIAIDRSRVLMITAHTPIASWHVPTLMVLFLLSVLGFIILLCVRKLPPLLRLISLSALIIGVVLSVLVIVQFAVDRYISDMIWPILYPANIILLYTRMIHHQAREWSAWMRDESIVYKNPILALCARILNRAVGWVFFAFLLGLPLFAVVTLILVLFGQAPDAVIRVFTDTSEWTLSTKISPPDLESSGHYLCTVAAQGHRRVVKPLRKGLRYGKPIVVNRQLCIANAFEQWIQECFPKFHRRVRYLYDHYGYPISRHITTQKRADLVYLLMKPLEWVFLLCLYLVTSKPENRIAVQYIR